ncbi:SulP family inorganic anion transporter [Lacihabitans sp. CCS-44]|uniref:SulP family inorganic anion transporter n=1 Tax=Lacihabitans sp. CCS-44 TaxID=2487331 RepID=UPI0020CFA0DE|nr:SulP family inorganic anion transporter [Lacihabitans sp. CCS-44]MCP9755814.1 SulP family inorganic anion transporter [Lacihabitans sp. CCS-44]
MSKIFQNLKYDLPSGLVVFLVALPLCLGISLASGAPFFSGIIAGIIGGMLIGAISNSQLSVSGPAAGLVAVVLAAISTLGSFEAFLVAVVLSGLMQIALGFMKAGVVANYFPSNVIKGMLSGIGIIIILKQIPHALGYDRDNEGDFAFLQLDGENSITSLFSAIHHVDLGATLIAIIGMAVILLFETSALKKVSKIIPGGLAAVIVSVLVSEFIFKKIPLLAISSTHLVNVPVPNTLDDFKALITFPDFTNIMSPPVWIVALTITAVASIETLLCIEAIDKLDPEKRITSTNRELIAQGIGNTFSGLIGGLPITSVIVRSSANLNANAKTKMSTIFHGFLLLASVLLIPSLLNKIPLAALAAILLFTGYKLAKPSIFKGMFANGKYQWIPFLVTVLAVVFLDLLKGVGIGLMVSVVYILTGNLKNSYYFKREEYEEGETIKIRLSEEVSFLNKAALRETLDHLPADGKVVIDATNTTYIDFDVIELIKEFKEIKAPLKNIDCELLNFKEIYQINSNFVSSTH